MAVAKRISNLSVFNRYVLNRSLRVFLPVFNPARTVVSSVVESFKFKDLHIEYASKAQERERHKPLPLFGETFSDHMFEVTWSRTTGWDVPKIVPLHNFQFHPGSKIFHYGQACFEGMKAFKHSDGTVALFRPEKNIQRLLSTAERAALPLFDGQEFLKCLKKLVVVEKELVPAAVASSLYIRPTFIGTQNSLGVLSSSSALLYVITCPVGPYFPSGEDKPISLLADPTYVRAWPGGVGDKKMACNYAPTLYVQQLAQDQGLHQVLWLEGDANNIAEVGAMNVFFFFQKGADQFELATPALNGTILPGVVRQSVLDLARKYNEFEVSERTITMADVMTASKDKTLLEMFVCGTACSICPVSSIKFLKIDIRIPTMNRENPLYKRLYKAITDIQYGRVESSWSVKVDES